MRLKALFLLMLIIIFMLPIAGLYANNIDADTSKLVLMNINETNPGINLTQHNIKNLRLIYDITEITCESALRSFTQRLISPRLQYINMMRGSLFGIDGLSFQDNTDENTNNTNETNNNNGNNDDTNTNNDNTTNDNDEEANTNDETTTNDDNSNDEPVNETNDEDEDDTDEQNNKDNEEDADNQNDGNNNTNNTNNNINNTNNNNNNNINNNVDVEDVYKWRKPTIIVVSSVVGGTIVAIISFMIIAG